jgi:hypothetical protein
MNMGFRQFFRNSNHGIVGGSTPFPKILPTITLVESSGVLRNANMYSESEKVICDHEYCQHLYGCCANLGAAGGRWGLGLQESFYAVLLGNVNGLGRGA